MDRWGWPQFLYAGILILGLILSAKDNGKPRSPESFGRSLFCAIIDVLILKAGGFF